MPEDITITEEDERSVLAALQDWAYGHPDKDRPLFVHMGEALTPVEYFIKAQEDKGFRFELVHFLISQARRGYRKKPGDLIFNAIKARK
jgi:hypothetical protein